MKKSSITLYLILLLGCSSYISAQTDTVKAKRSRNKLLDSVCNCINRADTNSINNIGDARVVLSGCITKNMSLLGEYAEATGINWEKITKEKLQQLTTYVLTEINTNCPAMKNLLSRTNTQFSTAKTDTTKAFQLKNRLIGSICLCISKTDTSSVNTLDDAQLMFSRCVTNNMELMAQYAEATGVDWSKITKEKFQELASYIAAEVYGNCPAMKTMINHVRRKSN